MEHTLPTEPAVPVRNTTYYVADKGPRSIRVYSCDDKPRLVVTIRTVDSGSTDELLHAYGWKRLGPWAREGEMPADHTVATLTRERSVHT